MESIWNLGIAAPSFPALRGDKKTEVLIIGGGIAGILTACFLHQKGVPYILVEKDRICCGNTGNTTAKITVQHGLVYNKIFRGCGAAAAQAYLGANRAAFRKYEELCETIDCDFQPKDNFVYSTNNRRRLEDEMDALGKIGCFAEFRENLPLPLETAGAVCFPSQAQFHPLKFLYSLAGGLHIYENTFVREMTGCTAVTDTGKITAGKVAVTTHFPFINKHGGYFLKLYQHRSYVLALRHAQDVHGMYVDESKTGLSFRNYGGLLLLGGGACRTGKKGGGWEALRLFAGRNYPGASEQYFWAAQDCMSLDHIPYIGQYSKSTENLYVASGFNKWGMTGAMASAMLFHDKILGIRNEYEDVFSPTRSILKPQLMANGFESAKNLLSISTKRCPHLGCALKWNRAEHSWDCACHGSRFSGTGRVLDNPANRDLRLK